MTPLVLLLPVVGVLYGIAVLAALRWATDSQLDTLIRVAMVALGILALLASVEAVAVVQGGR